MRRETFRGSATALLFAVAMTVGGCNATPSTPRPVATQTIRVVVSDTPPPSVACSADGVLRQVRELFAGQTFEAHYLTIAGELTMSVWFVDPAIDPAATAATLATNNRTALERGVTLSYAVVDRIPCARTVFVNVNPMIVDGRFRNWYINFIPIDALTALQNPSTDDLIAAVNERANGPGGRKRAPQTAPDPPGRCTWAQARAAIDPILRTGADGTPSAEPGNTVGYLIIGGSLVPDGRWSGDLHDDSGVEVQWTVASGTTESDTAILERLGKLAEVLSCVSPHLDSLEAFIVDPTGRLVAYGRVPGALVQPNAAPLPRALVQIQRYAAP